MSNYKYGNRSVFELLMLIPEGRVMTYGQVALLTGLWPRQVGRQLHSNLHPEKYPCHRVIKSDGSIATGYAFGGRDGQVAKLSQEGVVFRQNGKVDLEKCLIDL